MLMTRLAQAAMSGSCVTRTIVILFLRLRSLEQAEDLVAVRVSRLPVGSSARRSGGSCHERAGDRDALLLAAGELVRRVVQAIGEADGSQRLERALGPLAGRDAAVDERQLHVLERGGARQEVEPLEHEPDQPVAHHGAGVVRSGA